MNETNASTRRSSSAASASFAAHSATHHATPHRDSLRLAAIDVGSNSIHMIVAQVDADGGVTTLWRMKEMVGLGRQSFPSRRLSRESMDQAVVALGRFVQAARQRQAEKVVSIATSAVREATNGGDFIQRVKREIGLHVRVVSARDEARLIYLAVRHAVPLADKPHLIVDIGGGSVEFVVGDGRRAQVVESRKLGAARMTAQHVKSDPVSEADRASLARHYDRELGPLCETILAAKPAGVIGTSGTMENLAAMTAGGAPDGGGGGGGGAPPTIERKPFEKMLAGLLRTRTKDRAQIRGLDDQRKDQVIAGAILVGELFKRLDVKRITLCGSALREGILLDYLSRHIPDLQIRRELPDPRRRGVIDLARRCDWHQAHSEHVAMLCLRLFDELKSVHGLGAIERELIEYAALLHDIGWHIGRDAHHKHSMYLILHGGLKTFTDEEVRVMANVARYHRKNPPRKSHKAYASLPPHVRRTVDVGAALLRLADGLDRSHTSAVQGLHCKVGTKRVRCVLTARSDAELELWGARRKQDWFEKTTGREITFRLAGK